MAKIRIYRNPQCKRCARIARFHKYFDWANRIELSVSEPKSGPLALGEIAVEDLATGTMLLGLPPSLRFAGQYPHIYRCAHYSFFPLFADTRLGRQAPVR